MRGGIEDSSKIIFLTSQRKAAITAMAHTVFSILVTVWLYTVMPKVCRWLTNEKQRKTDIRLPDQ